MSDAERAARPSVVYRTGRLTKEDYNEAIETLIGARDEDPSKMCGSCHDTGHTAETCHHNPLVLARRGGKKEHEFRCFHCGGVFEDSVAQEHFGRNEYEEPACIKAVNNYDALHDIVKTLVELQDATKQHFDLKMIMQKMSVLEMAKALLLEIDGPSQLTQTSNR